MTSHSRPAAELRKLELARNNTGCGPCVAAARPGRQCQHRRDLRHKPPGSGHRRTVGAGPRTPGLSLRVGPARRPGTAGPCHLLAKTQSCQPLVTVLSMAAIGWSHAFWMRELRGLPGCCQWTVAVTGVRVTGPRRLALMMPFKFSDPGGCKPECQPRQQGDQVAQAQVTQGTRTVPVPLCTGDGARPRRRPGGGPGATGQIRQTRCRMIAGPRRGLAESDRPPLPA